MKNTEIHSNEESPPNQHHHHQKNQRFHHRKDTCAVVGVNGAVEVGGALIDDAEVAGDDAEGQRIFESLELVKIEIGVEAEIQKR